jgi:hypothetical protein
MSTDTALQSLTEKPWKAVNEELESQPLPSYDQATLPEAEAFRSEPFYQDLLQLGETWSPFEFRSYTAQNPNGFQPFTDLIDRWLKPQNAPNMLDYVMISRMHNNIQDQVVTDAERKTFHIPYVGLCKPLLRKLAFEVPLKTTHAAWITLALVARLVLLLGNPQLPTKPTLFLLMSHELKRYREQELTSKVQETQKNNEKKTKKTKATEEEKPRKQRTCNVCAQPGHNKRTCPQVAALATEPLRKKQGRPEKATLDTKQRDRDLLRMIQSLSKEAKEQLYQSLLH